MKKVYIKETRALEESENYRHMTNQSPRLFVQKSFIETQITLRYLYILCDCFCFTTSELNGCNRTYLDCKAKIFTIWPLREKLSQSLLYRSPVQKKCL